MLGFTAYSQNTVVDIIVNSDDHTILEDAVIAAELAGTLQGPGPFTVFAPTDDAFNALPDGVLNNLLQDPTGDLAAILLYHVLGDSVASSAVTNGLITTPLNTTNTLKFTRRSADDVLFVNQAQITVRDIPADNGVVHVIDAVVLPGETVVDVAIDNNFTTLTTAVVAAELLPALTDPAGTFTVFAPTDDAFAALPDGTLDALLMDPTGDLANILLYHVLGAEVLSSAVTNGLITAPLNDANTLKFTRRTADDAIFVNQASVSGADVDGGNGTVHIIDAVVLPGETVVDVAIDNNFTTLTTAVVAAELLPALTDPAGTFTVFAPTDDAFAALPDGTLDALLMDPTGDLANILLYHVLGAEVPSSAVTNGLITAPLNDANTLKFTRRTADDAIFVNQAQVTGADVDGGNGTVHIIDAVVLPGETVVDVAIDNNFTTLTTAVVAAELLPALTDPAGTFTVFAPTDDAFAALPDGTLDALLMDPTGDLANILLYHVLGAEVPSSAVTNGLITAPLNDANTLKFTRRTADDAIFVNQAQVTGADVDGGNGTVHIIDAVVLPGETVVDVAIDNNFTTLTTAVVAAELLPALTDPAGTFTVFAPTDDAFAALPDGTLDALLMDPTGDLADILLYHVLPAEVFSMDLSDGQMATTLLGQDVTVSISGDTVRINDAIVVMADVNSDNGVVHVIDAVLLPEITNVTNLQESNLDIEVFPNPASEQVNIQINEVVNGNIPAQLFDSYGRMVQQKIFATGNNVLNIRNLSNGLYYLVITVDQKRVSQIISIKN
jgi:uncharacterized surface protein with fasciclin (FAS1) repeats